MLQVTFNRSTTTRGQWDYLKSTAWAVLLSGGFGSGKTTGSAYKVEQLKSANGRVPGLLISQSHGQMEAILLPALRKHLALGVGRWRAEKMTRVHKPQTARYMDWGDGAPIYLRSGEHPETIDGLDVGWVVGDEPRHWRGKALEFALARARIPCPLGQRAFSSTPAMGALSNEFNSGKANRQLITAPTRENLANLPPDYIDNLRISYSVRMQKALLDGFFVPLEGAVYENLDPDIWNSPHVIDYDPRQHMGATTYLAVDPGVRRSSWLWVRELAPLKWVVFDEMMPENASDWACVEMVKNRGWPIDQVVCDAAANQRQSAFSITSLDMLAAIPTRRRAGAEGGGNAAGIIPEMFRGIEMGVDKVRTFFGAPEQGQPIRLFFARRLREIENSQERGVVKDHLGYVYPDVKPGMASIHKPLKDNVVDHSCDALRYLVVWLWMNTPLYFADPVIAQAMALGAAQAQR